MTTPMDQDQDLGPVRLAEAMGAARMIGRFSDRPVTTLSMVELELMNTAMNQLVFPLLAEITRRKALLEARHGQAGLRLVAAGGKLTEAGERSVRARKAARVRWSR